MPVDKSQEDPRMDPISAAAGAELAKAGGGVLSRLLGPLADEMGAELLTRYRNRNVRSVVARADAKSAGGTIPVRVAADVFEKAEWAEDEFVAEYLSGILACSRSDSGDDEGVTWTALIGRMSSSQLRAHYLVARAFRDLCVGASIDDVGLFFSREIVMNLRELALALDPEPENVSYNRAVSALYGLEAESLIKFVGHANGSELNEKMGDGLLYPDYPVAIVQLTVRGASLALQAAGKRGAWAADLIDPKEDVFDVLGLESSIAPVTSVLRMDLPVA